MALDIDGNMLSREELELKVLQLEKDYEAVLETLAETGMIILDQRNKIAELDTTVEGLSLLSAKLMADIARINRLMDDDGK